MFAILGFLRNLRQNEQGVTAIEFAIIAPVLFLMMMAIIEVSLIIFAQSTLEAAAFNASRIGKSGYSEAGSTRDETILAYFDRFEDTVFDTAKFDISSLTYARFDQIGKSEPFVDNNNNGIRDVGENYTDVNGNATYDDDMGAAGVGGTSEIVVYTINYPWAILTPIMRNIMGENGVMQLTSRAIIQNEPF